MIKTKKINKKKLLVNVRNEKITDRNNNLTIRVLELNNTIFIDLLGYTHKQIIMFQNDCIKENIKKWEAITKG